MLSCILASVAAAVIFSRAESLQTKDTTRSFWAAPLANRITNFARPTRRANVNIAVQVEPANGSPPEVEYKWDADTDILSAQLKTRGSADGMSGSVEVEGKDGSWIILDVAEGRINGVEVAVWPDVRKLPTLSPPMQVEDGRVLLPSRRSQPNIAAVEVDTPLVAEADSSERVIHFKLGKTREARTVRVGRDFLLDVDRQSQIAGLWLLNVPPFPDGMARLDEL
jgi:hypothetical protein